MVLSGSLGPWAPGSVTDYQTSDWACGQKAFRDDRARSGEKAGRSPSRSRVRNPPSGRLPLLQRARARGFLASGLPPPSPPARARPLPTRFLFAFSAAFCAPWPLRHIR